MKKLIFSYIVLLFFTACNSVNDFTGKKYYELEINIDAMSITEYQMYFTSSNSVEMSRTIYCNSMECLTKTNSHKTFSKTVVKEYNYNDGLLKIDGIPNLNKVSFLPNGDIKASTGEIIYKNSVTELNSEEKQRRITEFLNGNKLLGKTFASMLNNSAPTPLLKKKSNGHFKIN